jgi:rare lipoprotein A
MKGGWVSLLKRIATMPKFTNGTTFARFMPAILFMALFAGCAASPPGGQGGGNGRAAGYDRVGHASWYGGKFHGRTTASGQRYNMHAFTAAHRTLPFGTQVAVTNMANGRTVRLVINDRGPFIRGRLIDVSRRAAQKLGFLHQGTTRVRVRTVGRVRLRR